MRGFFELSFLALLLSMPSAVRAQGCETKLIQTLHSSSSSADDAYGAAIAMSGRRMAVLDGADSGPDGPFGTVYVYLRSDGDDEAWVSEDLIEVDGGFSGWMGNASLSLTSGVLALGVQEDNTLGAGAGAVLVYGHSSPAPGGWRLIQKLIAPDGGRLNFFGRDVAIHGEWLFVGAPWHSGPTDLRGAVYVFRRIGAEPISWAFWEKLAPRGLGVGDLFGSSLAVDGERVLVGAPGSDLTAPGAGALYEFTWSGTSWQENREFTAPGLDVGDSLGSRLALSGEWLFSSATGDDDLGAGSGAVHVFRWDTGLWRHHQKLLPELGAPDAEFGVSLAVDGLRLHVGDPFVSEAGGSAGAVYTFELEGASSQWLQTSRFLPEDLDGMDFFGGRVAADCGVVAAGAVKSLEPGAVYVFSGRPGREVSSYCPATSGAVANCAPDLDTLGAPSASQDSTFRMWSRVVPGAHSGVLLYSQGGSARPDLSAAGACLPTTNPQRKGLFWSGGTFGQCDGAFLLDWNEFVDDRDPDDSLLRTPGAVVHLQVAWFDPLAPGGVAWSNALAFQLCP